jgi:hypothetical protein
MLLLFLACRLGSLPGVLPLYFLALSLSIRCTLQLISDYENIQMLIHLLLLGTLPILVNVPIWLC